MECPSCACLSAAPGSPSNFTRLPAFSRAKERTAHFTHENDGGGERGGTRTSGLLHELPLHQRTVHAAKALHDAHLMHSAARDALARHELQRDAATRVDTVMGSRTCRLGSPSGNHAFLQTRHMLHAICHMSQCHAPCSTT